MKRLTIENWLQPDPVSLAWGRVTFQTGIVSHAQGEGWLVAFTRVELDPAVPLEVRRLFDTARAALVYGFLYYELYTLGLEQLGLVAEAAFAHRAAADGCPMQKPPNKKGEVYDTTFGARIAWMTDNGHLTPAEAVRWDGHRQWRNHGAHRDDQQVIPPTIAVPMLQKLAADINALFR
jgi:hypothetical protein